MASQFIEEVRSNMRLRGYSLSTEKTYMLWIRRFIHFSGNEHPATVPISQVSAYLTYLAMERHVNILVLSKVMHGLISFPPVSFAIIH